MVIIVCVLLILYFVSPKSEFVNNLITFSHMNDVAILNIFSFCFSWIAYSIPQKNNCLRAIMLHAIYIDQIYLIKDNNFQFLPQTVTQNESALGFFWCISCDHFLKEGYIIWQEKVQANWFRKHVENRNVQKNGKDGEKKSNEYFIVIETFFSPSSSLERQLPWLQIWRVNNILFCRTLRLVRSKKMFRRT